MGKNCRIEVGCGLDLRPSGAASELDGSAARFSAVLVSDWVPSIQAGASRTPISEANRTVAATGGGFRILALFIAL